MIILFYTWALAALYLIAFYLYFHMRLVFYKPPTVPGFDKPVSVVICARNEANNLKVNLPKILAQKNVHFEVVVVNDRSTDATAEVLARFKKQYPNLRVVENIADPEFIGKKRALLLGLDSARHDYFILTDADCAPLSDQWLSTMASGFHDNELILGASPYRTQAGLGGKLTHWETLLTAQNYLSMALAGVPYMGVGRNLGYTRKVFERSDRFDSHLHLPSGDDDLLVSQVAHAGNTGIQLHRHSLMWTEGPKDLKTWWRQKRRHLSTSGSLKALPKLILGTFGISQLIFYIAFIPVLIATASWQDNILIQVGILTALKFLLQEVSVKFANRRIYQSATLGFYPIWEFLTVLFLAIIHLQNKFAGRPKSWN